MTDHYMNGLVQIFYPSRTVNVIDKTYRVLLHFNKEVTIKPCTQAHLLLHSMPLGSIKLHLGNTSSQQVFTIRALERIDQ